MVDPRPLPGTTEILDTGRFQVARHSARSPHTGMQQEFLMIDIPDFVPVVGVTREHELVLVLQEEQT